MTFPLLIQPESQEPRVFTGRFTIGTRGDFVLDDEYASGEHAVCYPGGGGWLIEDLGSTNGTFVSGWQRLRGPRLLTKGDTVLVGHTVLTVVPVG